MAATYFRMAEGSRTTNRTLNAANSGNGLMVVNVALTTATPGDIIEVHTNTSGNNAFYTLVNTSGTLGYYVRPRPLQQNTANGNLVRLNRANPVPTSATAISGVFPLSGVGNLAAVWVPGALFITNGVWRNDRATISGTTISGNMGGWYVQEVPSEDLIILRPPDRGVGLSGATDGILTIRQGFHLPTTVPTNGETLGWTTWSASGILPLAGPNGDSQGSGELRDYLRTREFQQDQEARRLVLVEGLAGMVLSGLSGLSGITFPSQNDVFLAHRTAMSGNTTGNLTHFSFSVPAGAAAPATPIRMGIGENTFGDRYTVERGSVYVGATIPVTDAFAAVMVLNYYGSYLDRPTTSEVWRVSSGMSGVGSVFRGGLQPRTGALVESWIAYGGFGYSALGISDSKNGFVGSTAAAAAVSTSGTIFGGLILASGVTQPAFTSTFSSGDPMMVLDPRVDFSIGVYCDNLLGGTAEKRFTFNPAYVSADDTPDPTPISGGYVEIFEVEQVTEAQVLVFSGFTDDNGRLSGSQGVRLRRQFLTSAEVLTNFSHRMTFQGGGFRLHRFDLFALSGAFTQNITIPRVAPDYEGEYDE